jgi:hypothetical protein
MRLENSFPASHQPIAYSFPNNGVVVDRLPENLYNSLSMEIEKIQKDFESQEKFNSNLVGHIQKQFGIKFAIPLLNDYIVDLAEKHTNHFSVKHFSELSQSSPIQFKFSLESLWINFQKKHEFNPTHLHTGAYSFVIWMKIPYDVEEEKKIFGDMSNEDKVPSNFNFYYTNILGKIEDYTLQLDSSKEGCICLFPATLSHSVNPFYTSDNYRISIAGNVYLKPVL